MGCVVVIVLFAISFPVGFGFPYDELMQEQNDDTALVESTIREARAVRPQHIHDLLAPGKILYECCFLKTVTKSWTNIY